MKISLTVLILTCFEIMFLGQADARASGRATPISPTYVSIPKDACKTQAPKAPSKSASGCWTRPREGSPPR